jgi:outer membrane protein TolC
MIVRLRIKDCVQKRLFVLLVLTGMAAGALYAQNPSSDANPFWGSVTGQPATDQTLQLSLDDAVQRGLETNLGLREAESGEKNIHGQRNVALQAFLPTITLVGDTGFYQHNLAALGFKQSALSNFAKLFPGGTAPASFPTITRDTLTEGLVHFNQTLFSGPVFSGWKAANAAAQAAYYQKMSARGETVQQVANTYLHCIADSSAVDYANANVAQAQVLYNDQHEAYLAGTVAGLEEMRAKVELQTQQQTLIGVQNALDKDLILLKREIGIAPGQKITLTDPAPYSELQERPLQELLAIAYRSRQDYQNLRNQSIGFKAIHAAYRSQRWPTLKFSSYYGTQTVATIGTHGVFMAAGTLSVPIFREAELRGNEDASQAQLDAVNAQLDSLREQIEQQVRTALLDVNASKQLVEVARSNVDLASRALNDVTERVQAGVDTNLPLVTAQASLTSAQRSVVVSLYEYNVAKLALARATGVLETQYRQYLGR